MANTLDLQSSAVKGYAHRADIGRLYVFSANGLDVFRTIDMQRVAWAALNNVTCGTINDNGIYIGTSDTGVWRLPFSIADCANGDLAQVFGAADDVVLSSYNIFSISGYGGALAIATAGELVYIPDRMTVYAYTGSGATIVAMNDTYLIWADASRVNILNTLPEDDWSDPGVTIAVVANRIDFEADTNNLLISHEGGLRVVDCDNTGNAGDLPAGGLVGYYTMDAISGFTLTDETGTQNGTINGATQVDGYMGQALSFDGVNNTVSIAQNAAHEFGSTTDFTYAVWFKTSQSGRGDILENGYNGSAGKWSSLYVNGGYFAGGIDDGSNAVFASGTTNAWPVNDGQWHLGIVTFDRSGNLQRYIDGEIYGDPYDITSVGDITDASNAILIGRRQEKSDYFAGQLDSFRIYNRLLSTAEIADLFAETLPAADVGINYDTDLGTVIDCQAAWKSGDLVSYGTSDGASGGRFGVLDISDPESVTNKVTVAGDCQSIWIDTNLTTAIHDNTLERYRLVAEISPGANAIEVRRDWSLYAEITDALGVIQAGTVALTINGQGVAPTIGAITNGYAVSYTQGGSSGYAERVTVELSGTDSDGNTVSKTWSFVTASAPAATVTDTTPPNVVCVRDITLALAEADEVKDGVNVIWLEDISSPLIVDDLQAERRGAVAIDGCVYNEWRLSATFLPSDANGLATRGIRQGETVTMTVPAKQLFNQPCEVLAKQRIVRGGLVKYRLLLAHYEDV